MSQEIAKRREKAKKDAEDPANIRNIQKAYEEPKAAPKKKP